MKKFLIISAIAMAFAASAQAQDVSTQIDPLAQQELLKQQEKIAKQAEKERIVFFAFGSW